MPGFFISTFKEDFSLQSCKLETGISESLENKNFLIKRHTLNRFLEDKLFFEDESYIVITEGVILNKIDLMNKNNCISFAELCKDLYRKIGDSFFSVFRGSFSGAFYDKHVDHWTFFTSQNEDKAVFYYCNEGSLIVSSSIENILVQLSILNRPFSLNIKSSYDLLTYGFMTTNSTLINEIKKIRAGHYLKWENHSLTEYRYHRYSNDSSLNYDASIDELIESFDKLFTSAIKQAYNKDKEYGYEHLCCLSGGFDSRMNTFAADRNGYTKLMTNLCYSQGLYMDQTIAQKISKHLGTRFLFRALDDAQFLLDFREIVEYNYGLTLVSGSVHTNAALKEINFNRYGLLHTGQEFTLDSFVTEPRLQSVKSYGKLVFPYSTKLSHRVSINNDEDFDNVELFAIYNRGFRGNLGSQLSIIQYTDSFSPFMHPDVLSFSLSIPIRLRCNHNFYDQWIIKKYPDAAKFETERYFGGRVADTEFTKKIRRMQQIGVKNTFIWMLNKTGISIPFDYSRSKNSMNPFDLWYYEKENVRNSMDNYFKETIDMVKVDELLINDMVYLYTEGTVVEKCQVLTLLAAIDKFFT